jgi:pyruvate formate lyase activating enzyme
MIFDIKRYAVYDGPGIRTTVFFKGCPLSCQWCHNPEGMELKPEILLNKRRCAIDCRACVSACRQRAITKVGSVVYVDRKKCDLCGDCVDSCMYEALLVAGKKMRVQDVVEEVEKDRIFYDESAGGVTLSGGDPLLQIDFLDELLDEFRSRNIPVSLDTCGYSTLKELERVWDRIDLFLYDLKMMDRKDHEDYTGVSNEIILNNLRELVSTGKSVEIRIPLVSDVNDDETNILGTIQFLSNLENIQSVDLLPYHKGGSEKHIRLGKGGRMKIFKPPSKDRLHQIKRSFLDAGFEVKVGGSS